MKPYFAILIIFNLAAPNVFAKQQNRSTDSLKSLIVASLKNQARPDTLTISRINKLAKGYFASYPDSALYYGDLEIKLSKQINYKKGIADGLSHLAHVNTFRGDYATSSKNYTAALQLYQQIDNVHGICSSYQGLGYVQNYLGNYDAAIGLYNKSLALILKANDEDNEAKCYNLLGITYDSKGDYSKALDCYFKSLFINIKRKDELSSAYKYNNIGLIMQRLELYPKAINYYNRALAIWKKRDNKQGISGACQNIGETLLAQHKLPEAIKYLRKASAIFHQLGDTDGISLVYYDLGLYNYYTNHTDSAVYYLNLALSTATKNKILFNQANANIGLAVVYNLEKKYQQAYDHALQAQNIGAKLNSLSIKTDAALGLSKALAGLKRFEEAYHQYELYSALKSDLKHNESVHKIMLYNLELDFAKKQKDLTAKQRQKEKLYQQKIAKQTTENLVSAAVILILAIIAAVYYVAKSKQQKINALLAAQQADLNTQATKLNELNILKDRLIGVLAHDLRAPISTLRGLFNLMIDTSISTEEFIAMTPRVFHTLEHTSDFLDTLLFWINSQVDLAEDRTTNFGLIDIVNRELLHLEDKLKQKNITIKINVAVNTVAHADPNSVRIVVHNFLTNAIKFSNRDGIIEILAWLEGDEGVVFCLKDYGVGMTTEYLNTLFKSQVTSATGTENESGTGMGLLFCKDLIEKQKGKIWAKSNLGAGTELCFMLPAGHTTPA
ncbi:tetratricopeptide repeat-containing sensor histidine kinase [Mucilaginibacter sp. UYCu711]|uniref:tetratricopeptide repeat-containing sensor histidine kinase n=1 Tax=Mucilaginibacter sp. UYCu711 TaxID=3156339 RepID=UPI003D2638A6